MVLPAGLSTATFSSRKDESTIAIPAIDQPATRQPAGSGVIGSTPPPDSLVVNNIIVDSHRKEKESAALYKDFNSLRQDYQQRDEKAKRIAVLRIG